jgi:hypothetical protein
MTNSAAANNVPTATISATTGYKEQYCKDQSNKAALEDILPYGHLILGGDYRPSAVAGGTVEVASHVGPEIAAGSGLAWWIRSKFGVPMSITSKFLKGMGYAALAYTGYSALTTAQREYKACMEW